MDLEISAQTDDRDDLSSEMNDLLQALVAAHGDGLPDHVEGISEECDRYNLHMKTEDFGNAYGEVLAARGWSIVGYHSHYTDGGAPDRVSVRRTEDCTNEDTMFYRQGDIDKLNFIER